MTKMTDRVSREALKLTLKRYANEYTKLKRYYIPAFVMPGIGSILALFAPTLVVSSMLTHFQKFGSIDQQSLLRYIAIFSLIWFSGEMLWRASEWFNSRGQTKSMQNLYLEALDELLLQDISFFNNSFAGSLTKRALDYARNFEDFTDKIGKNLINLVVIFIFSFIILWQFSPWISLALVFCFIVTFRGSLYFLKKRMPVVLERNRAGNKAAGTLADIIANIFTVKMFGKEKYEHEKYAKDINHFTKLQLESWRIWNEKHDMFISPMYVLTNAIGLILAVYFGQRYGIESAAIFVSFNYFGRISKSLWELGPLYQQLERQISDAAEHVQAIMHPPLIQDIENAKKLIASTGKIQFKEVVFNYSDSNSSNLFDNFNLTINSGEKIGLIGHSGGGKSTITKLLLRLMDVNSGSILIDDQNIANITQSSLRNQISYVPQEPLLFHRTISENIKYGRSDALDGDIITASKHAHAHEFIEDLPNGYNTPVGERGVKLSGGQKQRIAIARAMLKDAPILVLDEATSALDSESETLIQDALWKLMEGRTTLVIAHRLSTIQKMDKIIVLDKGKIIEEGSHKELLAKNGVYTKLWKHQSGGFIEE
jgi:ATP-binding cassette subfamily B protein